MFLPLVLLAVLSPGAAQNQKCNAPTCWDEEIRQCTFECTWALGSEPVGETPRPTRRVTPRPTPRPAPPPPEPSAETEHPLLLSLGGLDALYCIDEPVRDAIIRYLFDTLWVELQMPYYGVELSDVAYQEGYQKRLSRYCQALPLAIKVKAPADMAEDISPYLMQALGDFRQEMVADLQKLDPALTDLTLSIESYNADASGLLRGSTPLPSQAPSFKPEPRLEPLDATFWGTIESLFLDTPPWVWWLSLTSMVLICCVAGLCCCLPRCQKIADRKEDKQDQYLDQFMQERTAERRGQPMTKAGKARGRPRPQPCRQQPLGRSQRRKTSHGSIFSHQSPTRRTTVPGIVPTRRRDNRVHERRSTVEGQERGVGRAKQTQKSSAPPAGTRRATVPGIVQTSRSDGRVQGRRSTVDGQERRLGRSKQTQKTSAPPVESRTINALEAKIETAVSAVQRGIDPPEEHALVVYDPNARAVATPPNCAIFADALLMEKVKLDREKTHGKVQHEAVGSKRRQMRAICDSTQLVLTTSNPPRAAHTPPLQRE